MDLKQYTLRIFSLWCNGGTKRNGTKNYITWNKDFYKKLLIHRRPQAVKGRPQIRMSDGLNNCWGNIVANNLFFIGLEEE